MLQDIVPLSRDDVQQLCRIGFSIISVTSRCAGTLLEGSYQMDDRLQTISFVSEDLRTAHLWILRISNAEYWILINGQK